jgi:carbon storage regulator
MLVVSRRIGEKVVIWPSTEKVTVTVVDSRRDRVRLGIDAPKNVKVYREEIAQDQETQE